MITEREMLTRVIAGTIDEEVVEKATAMIDKKDEQNSKRAAKAAEKRAQNTEFVDKFYGALTNEFQTATMLAEKLDGVIVREDGKALTPQYLARLAKVLVDEGKAVKGKVKIAGEKSDKVGYALA